MFAVAYDTATGDVIGVVLKDATVEGDEVRGTNGRLVTKAPLLLLEDDPGDITSIDALSEETVLAGAKEYQCARIRAASDAVMLQIENGYTSGEVKSWAIQKQGAKDILAGDATTEAAQYVAALAQARIAAGDSAMTVAILAGKIVENDSAATALGIATLGRQQGLEARVRSVTLESAGNLATALTAVRAISWSQP